MKRLITGILAIAVLLTFSMPFSAYGDEWSRAVELTLGNTASCDVNPESDTEALFSFTSPGTRFYTFTVLKPFEDYYQKANTAIYVTTSNYEEIGYKTMEESGNQLKVSVSLMRNTTYYIMVYDEAKACSTGQFTIQLSAEEHKHTLYDSELVKAEIAADGYCKRRCRTCDYVYKRKIPAIETVKLKKSRYSYNGKAKKPKAVVKDSKGNTLKENTDYILKYKKNDRSGVANAYVKFKGEYKGCERLYFYIKPKKHNIRKLKAGKKAIAVKWKKQNAGVDGYEIQCSKNKKFKMRRELIVSKRKKTSYKIINLERKSKYYVRIRSYSYDKINDKKLYSPWSKVKTIKTK